MFFSQFKIYITNPMSCTSIFSCYMTMISYFFIINQFLTYPVCITWLKMFFFFLSHDRIFVKMFFYCFFTVTKLFKHRLNKTISCIFTPVKNNWLAKFIIDTNKFISKNARNVILIFFSIRTTCFLLLLTLFKIHSKSV